MGMVPYIGNHLDCSWCHRTQHYTAYYYSHRDGVGLADGDKWYRGSRARLSSTTVGRRVPASGRRDSWSADWPAHCHSSGCRCAGMDVAVCVVFHSRRPLQNGGCNQAKISELGMGDFRRGGYAPFRDSSLGCVAVVGTLVPGLVGWNLVNTARLVPRDVRIRYPQPYRAAQSATPSSLNNPVSVESLFKSAHPLRHFALGSALSATSAKKSLRTGLIKY